MAQPLASQDRDLRVFAGGIGGWVVLNTTDEMELAQVMMEFPFGGYSSTEVIPTVNGDEALDRLIETINAMLASMKPS